MNQSATTYSPQTPATYQTGAYTPPENYIQPQKKNNKPLIVTLSIIGGILLILLLICGSCIGLFAYVIATTEPETPQLVDVNGNELTNGDSDDEDQIFYLKDYIEYDGVIFSARSVVDPVTKTYGSASNGNRYIGIEVYIKNIDSYFVYPSAMDFSVKNANGEVFTNAYIFQEEYDELNFVDLERGESLSGYIFFEIPANESVRAMTLTYEVSYSSDVTVHLKPRP